MTKLKDKAAIVGIGETEYSKNSGMSNLALLLQAAKRAIEDSGLTTKDIDGVIPGFIGISAEHLISNFGLADLRYTATVHIGGASAVASLQTAAMAIATGIAHNVVCLIGWNGYSGMRPGAVGTRVETLPPLPMMSNLREFEMPFGSFVPAHWFAPL
ncbi:MAG: transporter, partial [Dehalococcoidia bacterium]